MDIKYIVMSLSYDYDDQCFYCHDSEAGYPIEGFSTREMAEREAIIQFINHIRNNGEIIFDEQIYDLIEFIKNTDIIILNDIFENQNIKEIDDRDIYEWPILRDKILFENAKLLYEHIGTPFYFVMELQCND